MISLYIFYKILNQSPGVYMLRADKLHNEIIVVDHGWCCSQLNRYFFILKKGKISLHLVLCHAKNTYQFVFLVYLATSPDV